MGELVAVYEDPESHGAGDLDADVGDKTVFINGKWVIVKGCQGLIPDDLGHSVVEVKAFGTSATVYVYGIKLHRNNDARECGATTIVEGQSTVYCG